jgi:hypothetical protein
LNQEDPLFRGSSISGCSDLSCDPFNEFSKQSILSFCKQYLNYVDSYGKNVTERNFLSPKENLPHSDVLILSECRLAAAALMKCRDKVKHKKVNDLSGIFL